MTEHKTEVIVVRISKADKRMLDDAARRENLPTATWIRALCLAAARAAKGHTMKTILILAILGLAACGGTETDELFKGDVVVAEIRNGQPFCNPGGESGPSYRVDTLLADDESKDTTYEQQQLTCTWQCGAYGGDTRVLVTAIFHTVPNGAWHLNVYTDHSHAACPTAPQGM